MSIDTVDQRPLRCDDGLRENEPTENSTDRQGDINSIWNGLFWIVLLERNCGRHHLIIYLQLDSLRETSQLKSHNSSGLIKFLLIFFNTLKALKNTANLDLQPRMTQDKLPQGNKDVMVLC